MKKAFTTVIAFLALAAAASGTERVERTALLLLPEEVSAHHPFRAAVEFRWDDEAPLRISTWTRKDVHSTLGEIQVFDEHGKEVQMFFPVSIPTVPDGERTVKKGEVLRIDLDLMGWPVFERAGSYYAIATFSYAWCDGANVRFTTKKRWFRVAERSPKNA